MNTPILFCNIGWMSRYEGLDNKSDKIVGGGSYVRENKSGDEVCNFVKCDDGYVYGHVESIKGAKDRSIKIERLGGNGDYVEGIDVVWTATHPDQGGRRLVGWYRNATIYRERQEFASPPSGQHSRDGIKTYRIRALAKDTVLLDQEVRDLRLGGGPGWMGQTPWWSPSADSATDIRRFVEKVRKLVGGDQSRLTGTSRKSGAPLSGGNSSSASADPYRRYVEAYEIEISPRHNHLQEAFERHLQDNGATNIRPDVNSVDLRYTDPAIGPILVEVKPCETSNARYAVRTAVGQLLDYRQREKNNVSLLIVLGSKPSKEDRDLATSNDFGVAYPDKNTFKFHWPAR